MITYKFINQICTGHASPIPESASDKIYNSIVKIILKNGHFATGFLMKLTIKNNQLKYLITNNHVIPQTKIDSEEEIHIFYGTYNQEIKRNIKLNKKERFIKTFIKPVDITLIEILDKDSLSDDKFLFPDLNYKYGFNFYKDKDFYLAGYPENFKGERTICSGKIIGIQYYSFFHTMETKTGSSGSPIFLKDNICIIGIHRGGNEEKNINIGTFMGIIIDDLEKKDINELNHNQQKILQNQQIYPKELLPNEILLKQNLINNNNSKLYAKENINKKDENQIEDLKKFCKMFDELVMKIAQFKEFLMKSGRVFDFYKFDVIEKEINTLFNLFQKINFGNLVAIDISKFSKAIKMDEIIKGEVEFLKTYNKKYIADKFEIMFRTIYSMAYK